MKGARKWHPYVLRVRGRPARRPAPLRTAPKLPNSQARSSLVSCWREPGGALGASDPVALARRLLHRGGLDELNALMRISENMEHVFKASWWPQCRPASLDSDYKLWRFCFLFSLLPGEGVYTGRAYTAHTDTCYLYMYWKKNTYIQYKK